MGVVMIKCPATGRAIPTDIMMDRERFRCSPVFFGRTFCSICKTSHEWFARGRLGSRARGETAEVDGLTCAAAGVTPLRLRQWLLDR